MSSIHFLMKSTFLTRLLLPTAHKVSATPSQSYFVHPLDFPSRFSAMNSSTTCSFWHLNVSMLPLFARTLPKIPGQFSRHRHSASLKSIKVLQKIGVHLHHVINWSGKISGRSKDLGGGGQLPRKWRIPPTCWKVWEPRLHLPPEHTHVHMHCSASQSSAL